MVWPIACHHRAGATQAPACALRLSLVMPCHSIAAFVHVLSEAGPSFTVAYKCCSPKMRQCLVRHALCSQSWHVPSSELGEAVWAASISSQTGKGQHHSGPPVQAPLRLFASRHLRPGCGEAADLGKGACRSWLVCCGLFGCPEHHH